MNTFIKRSIKIALAIVFIGAAAVPACAQNKKGIVKGAKAALGKKPPLTGTAPVVKPVTPRVPPTLQGTQVPTRFAVPNEALNAAVEREISAQALTKQMISSLGLGEQDLRTNGFITPRTLADMAAAGRVSGDQLIDYIILTKPVGYDIRGLKLLKSEDMSLVLKQDLSLENPRPWSEDWSLFYESIESTNFSKWITPNTPKFIPIDFDTNIMREIKYSSYRSFPNTFHSEHIALLVAVTKIDKTLFVEKNGKLFINTDTLIHINSYGEALLKLDKKTSVTIFCRPMIGIAKLRNQQIMDALKNNQDKGVNSLEEVKPQAAGHALTDNFLGATLEAVSKLPARHPVRQEVEKQLFSTAIPAQHDITTQRTAEEIKNLVENLDPENSLRQAIEGTLKDNGYIAPAE